MGILRSAASIASISLTSRPRPPVLSLGRAAGQHLSLENSARPGRHWFLLAFVCSRVARMACQVLTAVPATRCHHGQCCRQAHAVSANFEADSRSSVHRPRPARRQDTARDRGPGRWPSRNGGCGPFPAPSSRSSRARRARASPASPAPCSRLAAIDARSLGAQSRVLGLGGSSSRIRRKTSE